MGVRHWHEFLRGGVVDVGLGRERLLVRVRSVHVAVVVIASCCLRREGICLLHLASEALGTVVGLRSIDSARDKHLRGCSEAVVGGGHSCVRYKV